MVVWQPVWVSAMSWLLKKDRTEFSFGGWFWTVMIYLECTVDL